MCLAGVAYLFARSFHPLYIGHMRDSPADFAFYFTILSVCCSTTRPSGNSL